MKKVLLLCLVCCALGGAARAATLQDEDASAVYFRDGVRYALEGRLDEAAAAFRQATRLDRENGDAFYNLGNVYAEQGRWPEAVGAYRMAVILRKRDGAAHNGLGVALAAWGEYERAVESFKRAVEIYPEWAEPRYHLSEVYKKLGRDAESRAAYSEALKRRPDYATNPPRKFPTDTASARDEQKASPTNAAPSSTSRVPATTNRPPAAVLTADAPAANASRRASAPAANRPAPPDGSPYELGLRHRREGRYEEAVAAFTEAARLDRNGPAAFSALGETYARLGRWRESVDAYEQAVRLDPRDANVYEMLGRSYAKLRAASTPAPEADASGAAAGVRAANTTPASAEAPNGDALRVERPEAARPDADPASVYRVGPGDVLEVRATRPQGARPTAHKVTPTGLLDYTRLGAPLKVEGLTTDEIAARLGAELRRRGEAGAEVSVGVREYESHAVIVSGLVRDPGTKILRREGVPLYVIVAHAQPLAEAGQVLVVPRTTGQVKAVNLKDSAAMKMLVRPGDVVTVQALPRQFYFVAGEVRLPGQKEFHGGLTLTQAVAAAGGVTQASATEVTVTRQGADGRLATTRYSLRDIEAGRSPDPLVQPGDRVEVRR
ncbi:MAG TPA: tetratricopeptide repeat protein [Pyrinomonadaceae bacterium]|nr:tetratricopeptide repeat protein [Pyrinomonadaceae bacterium]